MDVMSGAALLLKLAMQRYRNGRGDKAASLCCTACTPCPHLAPHGLCCALRHHRLQVWQAGQGVQQGCGITAELPHLVRAGSQDAVPVASTRPPLGFLELLEIPAGALGAASGQALDS
jgi:hypothetical protein